MPTLIPKSNTFFNYPPLFILFSFFKLQLSAYHRQSTVLMKINEAQEQFPLVDYS